MDINEAVNAAHLLLSFVSGVFIAFNSHDSGKVCGAVYIMMLVSVLLTVVPGCSERQSAGKIDRRNWMRAEAVIANADTQTREAMRYMLNRRIYTLDELEADYDSGEGVSREYP